jgi:hypothetical protein
MEMEELGFKGMAGITGGRAAGRLLLFVRAVSHSFNQDILEEPDKNEK